MINTIETNGTRGSKTSVAPLNGNRHNGSLKPAKAKASEYLPNESEEADSDLKAEFQAALTNYGKAAKGLRDIVQTCFDGGIDADELVEWALELPGWTESTVRSVISHVLRDNGVERRAKGAGRKVNAVAKAIYKLVLEKFGDKDIAKNLLAASRYAKAQS